MPHLVLLRSTLKRGAIVAAANWPVVAIQFVAESTFKLLLGVPIVGGAVLVALALGRDLRTLLAGDLRDTVTDVVGALAEQPGALAAFVVAVLIVLAGGSALMFLVKGGTVTVLAAGDAAAGTIERPPVRLAAVARAGQYSVDRFLLGASTLFRRYLRLGLVLFAVYLVSGAAFLAVVFGSHSLVGSTAGTLGWTVVAAVSSSALLVWITIVNLVYLLLQMIVAIEDCSVRQAVRRLGRFLRARLREVFLVFVVVLALVVVATAASLLATTGLSLISFIPLIGLAVFPLQAAAWLVRGLVFQYLGLTALGAYVSQYRGSGTAGREANAPALLGTAS
jgi:hypothetical protein